MLFQWDDKQYPYKPEAIDLPTAFLIKAHTGLGLRSWAEAIDDFDPAAIQCLGWAIKHQNGEVCDVSSIVIASVPAFMREYYRGLAADAEATKAVTPRTPSPGTDPLTGTPTPTSDG